MRRVRGEFILQAGKEKFTIASYIKLMGHRSCFSVEHETLCKKQITSDNEN
jgi:hypothetical protein